MDGLGGYYASEKSQTEKTNAVFSLIHAIYKTSKTKYNKTKTDSQIWRTSLWLPEQRRWGMYKTGEEKRLQTSSYKLIGSRGYKT